MISQALKRINPFSTQAKSEATAVNSDAGPTHAKAGEGIVFASIESLIALRRSGEQLQLKISKSLAMQSGAYHSAFRGRGMEFDETRPYQAGDDVRSLDWRVTARTGKPYTKLFREEREQPIFICVDFRKAMFFATRGKFKSVCAAELAATIAWCAVHQGDRLGGLLFSDEEHTEIRPQRGKSAVLHFVKKLSSQTQTLLVSESLVSKSLKGESLVSKSTNRQNQNENEVSLQSALLRLRRVAKPGSKIFIISDFRLFDKLAESHLTYLSNHCEVVLLCINDPLERALPKNGCYRLTDRGTDVTIDTSTKRLCEDYHAAYVSKMDDLYRYCRSHQMHFSIFSTADDVVSKLANVLRKNK